MSRSTHDLRELSPSRVCLIKPSALGDVTNAYPVLSALRARWPNAHLTWVINKSLRGLLDGHPDLDEVITYDRAGTNFRPQGIRNFARFLSTLRAGRFDLAIDLQGLLRSGLMAAATRAPIRVGFADAREGAPWFYTHRVVTSPSKPHAVDRLLEVAESFGADVKAPKFLAPTSISDQEWAHEQLNNVSQPRLMLNMGARWETKRWPAEHFAEVARRAVEHWGAGLVVVGAPEDRPIVERFQSVLGDIPIKDLCGRTTLPQLAALACRCDLVLSNDTGPLHLATAAGAKTIGIYTCTLPALNGPYGPRASAITTKVACAGSYLTRCARLDCFQELSVDRVWGLVSEQLGDASPRHTRHSAHLRRESIG